MATAQAMIPTDVAAALRYGPDAQSAITRSRYLADALKSLQDSGQHIGSKTELWTKLLATAITSYSRDKADTQAVNAIRAQQDREGSAALADLGPGADAPQLAKADTSIPLPPPAAAAPALGPSPTAAAAFSGASYTPADRKALAEAMATEARGEGDTGELAVGNVALNRLKAGYGGAKSLADVVYAPHQFEGISKASTMRPQDMSHAQQLADALLGGDAPPDNTGGAMNFLNPELQTQLGRQIPAWAQGNDGRRIGHHVFFGGGNPQGNAAPPAMPGGGGPAYNPPPPPPDPLGPPVQNVQVPQGSAAPAPGPGGMAPGASPPQAAPGASTMPPTPQQVALAKRWLANPATYDQGLTYAHQLAAQAAEARKFDTTNVNGLPVQINPYTGESRAVSVPAAAMTRTVPGRSPSDFAQVDPLGKETHQTIGGVQGAIPEGMVRDPTTGAYVRVPTQAQQTFRMQGVNGVFVMGPDGKPQKVGDDQYGPSETLKMRESLATSEPVKNYQSAMDAYGAMLGVAKQNPNGMRAYALMDTLARAINPGAVARPQVIEAIKNARGIPDEVKGFFMNLQGDGILPPEQVQHILDVTRAFVASHRTGADTLIGSNVDYAKRHNIDPADVTIPLVALPDRYVLPSLAQPAAVAPGSQAAAIAEARRRGLLK